MNIGIIGSGAVGIALAKGFIKYGYHVMIGTNNIEKHENLKTKTEGKALIGNFEETAKFGNILVLAVKGIVAQQALEKAGIDNLKGKTILDATNPIGDSAPLNGVLNFFTDLNNSLMERLQTFLPEGNFVKCFSSVGSHLMVNPDFGDTKPSMFICGNSEEAKEQATVILNQFGWETEDMGKVESARAIEPLCMLWCIPGFASNQWVHAFKLLKK